MPSEITSADGERPESYGAWTPEARQREFERLAKARGSVVHLMPRVHSGLTACCGKTLFELPGFDRTTMDPAQATCSYRARKRGQSSSK